jgi:hypothetical protein
LWLEASASAKYNLPDHCPICLEQGKHCTLKTTHVYVGVFPYIHADFTMQCRTVPAHKYNFCFPFNKAMVEGFTSYDTEAFKRYRTERVCPFHNTTLVPVRLYGDLVFTDGTRKMQLRCPTCFYSERVVFNGEAGST